MIISKYFKRALLLVATIILCGACSEDVEVGNKVNEDIYQSANRVDGMLLDTKSNQNNAVVELYADEYKTAVYFRLSSKYASSVDVTVEYDAAYIDTYNAENGTDFALYPKDLVEISGDGKLSLSAGQLKSSNLDIKISAQNEIDGDTYAIPLKLTSVTDGVALSDRSQYALYFVKDRRNASDTFKGEDAVKTVVFFDGGVNPLNALEFVLKESGKLFFDEVVIFSANINYNAAEGRVFLNDVSVKSLLEKNEVYIQPLRKRGIKVLLSILGNWDQAGCAQLSTLGAKQFAKELAAYCYSYNLDGVVFDDEYQLDPDLNNPLFAPRSQAAAARLMYETKKLMPDKRVVAFYWESIQHTMPAVDGVLPGEFVDYGLANYGSAAPMAQGMTLKNCSGMSVELQLSIGDYGENRARSIKQAGYGYYMYFALNPKFYFQRNNGWEYKHVDALKEAARGLYEEELVTPTHYYDKENASRIAF